MSEDKDFRSDYYHRTRLDFDSIITKKRTLQTTGTALILLRLFCRHLPMAIVQLLVAAAVAIQM